MMLTCKKCGKYYLCYYDFDKEKIIGVCPCYQRANRQMKLKEFGVE